MSDDEGMSDNVSLSSGALLGPESPKNAAIQELLGGIGCLTMKGNDKSADKAAATLGDMGWSIQPSGGAGPAPLPAAGADGDNAVAARRWRGLLPALRSSPSSHCNLPARL